MIRSYRGIIFLICISVLSLYIAMNNNIGIKYSAFAYEDNYTKLNNFINNDYPVIYLSEYIAEIQNYTYEDILKYIKESKNPYIETISDNKKSIEVSKNKVNLYNQSRIDKSDYLKIVFSYNGHDIEGVQLIHLDSTPDRLFNRTEKVNKFTSSAKNNINTFLKELNKQWAIIKRTINSPFNYIMSHLYQYQQFFLRNQLGQNNFVYYFHFYST